MPVRRTQTPEGVPGFNCVECAVCAGSPDPAIRARAVLYRKKALAMPDGTFRCKKHKAVDPNTSLFDVEEFNP